MITVEQSKAQRERARRYPISHGNRTVYEAARLLAGGLTFRDVAARWDMLPRAGAADLKRDLFKSWRAVGYPGGMPLPEKDPHEAPRDERPYWDDQWRLWRAQRDESMGRWLASLVGSRLPPAHCPTCRCQEGAP